MDFSRQLASLLMSIESAWSSGSEFNVAEMFALEQIGRELVREGVQPEFKWVEPHQRY
jgi:hypothetical protein